MATLSSKPGLRYSASDWATNNKQISHTAENKRNISHEIRQEGRALRNETTSKTNWDEYDSSRRLSDRINDVTRWKENLKACAQQVDAEMDALTLVQFGLVDEAKQLEATILALKQKLAHAQHSLQSLKQHEAQMIEDLSRKQDALSLEQRSSQTRQRLTLGVQTEGLPSAVVPLTNSSGRHKLDLA
ncbi:tektin-2-like [Sinocyclocheilus rhinocerous]|uniref:tektin-2-like n=1 Tax=Sinocyclocheilus rhinocerous TaxID=307959 RepID=UPI0007B8C083|nr:PREDICTED: tektin-2-like [Sinocyclocheilus rhinocerous]